jgi:hypothetical protein
LYAQTGEVLKRWRERNEARESPDHTNQNEVAEIKLAKVFGGQMLKPRIHFDVVERLEPRLRAVRKELSSYADETYRTDPTDEKLVMRLDGLRQMLEAVYQQRITFRGEPRPPSGTTVEGEIEVERLEGDAAAVRAGTIKGGEVKGTIKVKEVASGGKSGRGRN